MSHQLKIHVENDTLIMRGSPEESVGCVLRGCVILHTKEAMKVKSITLNLTGRMKVQWSERNHHHKKEAVILEHNWTFLAQRNRLHQLSPNVYKYPFEYILPGNLAESVDTNNTSYGGSLSYKLKAVVDRPAFSPNLISRQPLRIVRELTLDDYNQYHSSIPMQICNEWANKVDYKITVPKKIFSRGEEIPIEFSLMPKPNSESLHVRYLSCFLKEYISFAATNGGDTTTMVHTESRIIRFFRDESFPSNGLHWKKTQVMSVPHSLNSIQCDTQNQFFEIHHKLKFTMSLINKRGELSELRATMPIDILNGKVQQQQGQEEEEMENELPTYENAWRSALYSPLPYLDATSPYSPSDETYPITPSHICNNSGTAAAAAAGDYFAYQPVSNSNSNNMMCGLLPSYHSVMIAPPEDDNDGLPSYE